MGHLNGIRGREASRSGQLSADTGAVNVGAATQTQLPRGAQHEDPQPVMVQEIADLSAQFWIGVLALSARERGSQHASVVSLALASLALQMSSPTAAMMMLSAANAEADARQQVRVQSVTPASQPSRR